MPFPSQKDLTQPALERSLGGTTLFSVPAGFLSTGHLAAGIQSEQAPLLWLRAAPEDRDPAGLLASLASGLAGLFPAVSARTLERMRSQPGPLYGWGPLFSGLARDLSDALPPPPTQPGARFSGQPAPFSLVIEHIDRLNEAPQTLALLWDHFLPLLPSSATRILTRHSEPARSRIPGYVRQVTARELRFDERACLALAHESCIPLPARSLQRMAALTEGREVVISELLSACQLLGIPAIIRCLDEADNLRSLLTRLARYYLDAATPGVADLLFLALHLEYIHPPLIESVLGQPAETPDLFYQSLSGGWFRLRCVWQNTLRAAIRPGETQSRAVLNRAARFLLHQGDFEQAIPLLLELGEPQEAAQVIVQVVEPLMDLGQWETLSGWLKQLPEAVRRDWPWLVFTEGELAAARGQDRASRRIFATATRLFQEHHDIKGTCQSLLTESCLSAWEDELPKAQEYAMQARTLAEQNRLSWYQGWANWQLGRLSASAGRMTEALAFFIGAGLSAEHSSDIQMASFISQARQLVQTQVEQQQKKAQHVQAYYEADRAEHEAAARLRFHLENPASQADSLRGAYGWSRTPLFLKLPPPGELNDPFPGAGRLLGLLRGILHPSEGDPSPGNSFPGDQAQLPGLPPGGVPIVQLASVPHGAGLAEAGRRASSDPVLPVTGVERRGDGASGGAEDSVTEEVLAAAPDKPTELRFSDPEASAPVERSSGQRSFPASPHPPVSASPRSAHRLDAYLLGVFRVIVDDTVVEALPAGRGRSVLAYLLLHDAHPLPREVIMEAFWPEASPDAARNSLNVAIHSLRQALKAVLDTPVILFQENAYLLNPDLARWIDTKDFEACAQEGRRNETARQTAAAIRNYEKVLSFYQGDLLADFPYEEWAVLERERLRVLHLETLERLSLMYFSQSEYTACAGLCNRILSYDSCREDAHCRLMRCYARQGQAHLALRQYQSCVEALRRELDVLPAPATVQLYEQIRRRSAV